MNNDVYTAWQFQPGLDIAAAMLASLAVYVGFDFSGRVPHTRGWTKWLWLLGSAVALGTGIWSVHFVAFAIPPLPFKIGYGGALTAIGWLVDVFAAGLALYLAGGRRVSRSIGLLAAPLMAVVSVGTTVLYLLDLHIAPSLEWHVHDLVAAGSALTVMLAISGWMVYGTRRRSLWMRIGAAAFAGIGFVVSDNFTTEGTQAVLDAMSLNYMVGVSDLTMTTLATLGSGSLLGVLLLLSIIEGRMNRALQSAIARIDEAARTDPLTRLPNRVQFDQRLEAAARHADANDESLALLFVGLDSFKTVNDSFGRRVGDLMLQDMATRLRAACPAALIARAGGDEFVVLLAPKADKAEAAAAAQRLLRAFAEAFELEGRNVLMTCSIGVVLYPESGNLSGAMLRAEAAARHVKRSGGATFAFFEPRMLGDAREQVELLHDLRQAIALKQLELYFQPKIHAPSGEVTGAEALLRWHHPQRGMISPAVFVPLAERHGLIGALGQWVIEEACHQASLWRDQGLRMRVAINLSVHQLHQPDLAERIAAALKAHQLNPHRLTCEITESAAMEDAEGTMKVFERLAAVGVHISIDDFGTGYSSLSYLRKLPAEELKIDRSFVLDLETSADARAVVEAVVKLAQALGLKVVAEGVETEAQNQILRSLGCDELQGYLFAKPMSAKAIALWAMNDVGPRAINFRDSLFAETLPSALP